MTGEFIPACPNGWNDRPGIRPSSCLRLVIPGCSASQPSITATLAGTFSNGCSIFSAVTVISGSVVESGAAAMPGAANANCGPGTKAQIKAEAIIIG